MVRRSHQWCWMNFKFVEKVAAQMRNNGKTSAIDDEGYGKTSAIDDEGYKSTLNLILSLRAKFLASHDQYGV
jgi:hypothetical protein